MTAPEYKVITVSGEELEQQLNTLARDRWRPLLIAPDRYGGASWIHAGASRVTSFRVVLVRD
jgi:hypothetical protein